MDGVETLDPGSLVLLRTPDHLGIGRRINGCECKHIVNMRATVRVRALRVLDRVRTRGDHFKRSVLTQCKDAEDRFRLSPDAELSLIVERALDRAEIEIYAHA